MGPIEQAVMAQAGKDLGLLGTDVLRGLLVLARAVDAELAKRPGHTVTLDPAQVRHAFRRDSVPGVSVEMD